MRDTSKVKEAWQAYIDFPEYENTDGVVADLLEALEELAGITVSIDRDDKVIVVDNREA